MVMTLERYLELKNIIKDKGKWDEYKKRILFLYKEHKKNILNEKEYLSQHERVTRAFAGVE